MGVSEMTHVSYFFTAMAAVFGCVSAVMYFMFDIRRCWRIARGTYSVAVREKKPVGIVSNKEEKNYGLVHQKTEKLASDKTETPFTFEETVPLETITLVQDIVMMTDIAMDADTELR